MTHTASGFTIYHNPRCSKSRRALALLEAAGERPEVVEYLKTPPTRAEPKALLKKLALRPAQIVRTGEVLYKEKYQGRDLSDEQWLDALVENPVLMERPIVVKGERAIDGRPPEQVLEIL
ncbi:MAG TPA: arsenate reductase (glutaredoxin) [Burkholderiales bacterium]|nr:arsenate reductase (glutaredoxin) [Burkholderiales bacterium]